MPVAAGVGDLDAQGAADDVERESEVPAWYAAVRGRVGRQLGHDVLRRVQREAPVPELLNREQAGLAGSARCGWQECAEVAGGVGELGLGFGGFLIHVTQRGRPCLP